MPALGRLCARFHQQIILPLKTLIDTPQLRARRAAAYHAGQCRFDTPPVYSGNWSVEAWCNWVRFNDESLNGFLPYTR